MNPVDTTTKPNAGKSRSIGQPLVASSFAIATLGSSVAAGYLLGGVVGAVAGVAIGVLFGRLGSSALVDLIEHHRANPISSDTYTSRRQQGTSHQQHGSAMSLPNAGDANDDSQLAEMKQVSREGWTHLERSPKEILTEDDEDDAVDSKHL